MKRGIIYVATGKKYHEEACLSAASVRRWMPDMSITLFTDQESEGFRFGSLVPVRGCGDGFKDKVTFMARSPYEDTLFLDTDTFLCGSVEELFTLLERFDVALAHDHLVRQVHAMDGVPACYPEFNSGVLLFRNGPGTRAFFEDWLRRFEEDKARNGKGARHPDQPSLRQALFFNNLRIATLTPEYNCMFRYAGSVSGPVKILHCARIGYGWYTQKNLERVAQVINSVENARVFICGRTYAFLRKRKTTLSRFNPFAATYTNRFTGWLFAPDWVRRLQRLGRALRKHGFSGTARIGIQRIRNSLRVS